MRYARINDRLAGLGGAKWGVHVRANALAAQGHDVIRLTIGEPDVSAPGDIVQCAADAMKDGRTGYSDGRGEIGLRQALANRYSDRTGRPIGPDQVLCLPGTQTALFVTMMGLTEESDEVLTGDPLYATYEGVIRASGARMVSVPLRSEMGFRLQADDIEARITSDSRAILLNTPHNPTGAVLTRDEVAAIGEVARRHDLWIVSDEVYEELIFKDVPFASPLSFPELADRTVVVSSISKSHAAPGFRSGWAVASAEFVSRLLPLAETMLFGNQPFIADMTEMAVRQPSEAAAGMRKRFARRATRLTDRLEGDGLFRVNRPQAGMFALIDISSTGMDSETYASDLLERTGVAVMPGTSFGDGLAGWVRVALTVPDETLERACDLILGHAETIRESSREAAQ